MVSHFGRMLRKRLRTFGVFKILLEGQQWCTTVNFGL